MSPGQFPPRRTIYARQRSHQQEAAPDQFGQFTVIFEVGRPKGDGLFDVDDGFIEPVRIDQPDREIIVGAMILGLLGDGVPPDRSRTAVIVIASDRHQPQRANRYAD